mgnify:CR=1 FL=1
MKLLTTIAAVLISISAFSQDLIEYNESTYSLNGEKVSLEYKKSMTGFNPNAESMFEFSLGGTFSRNGEVLTMEQIQSLTKRYNVGGSNLRRGNRFDRMYENQNYRITNNIGNFVVGSAAGFIGSTSVWIGTIFIYDVPIGAAAFLGAGTGLCVGSYKAFEQVSLKEGCLRRRDNQFNKVADKLNKAIKAANQ